ncbi:MAG TPA: type II toxin-antitoxin system VapC family toxin [Methylocystis sp.]|nr:type II toxin-antitoxin system VapC family toxin [Methylocystis sp.]
MFVDASAMVAILLQEADGEELAAAIDANSSRRLITNVIAVWETAAAIYRKKKMPLGVAEARVADFIAAARIEVLSAAPDDLALALAAFDRYGRHRYPAPADRNKGLNLADCLHYACAKSRGVPILSTDEGFALTDLPKA